jgi:hypothetical protein
MAVCFLIKGGVVTRYIEVDADEVVMHTDGQSVGLGWLYDGKTFTAPLALAPVTDDEQVTRTEAMLPNDLVQK